MNKATLVYMVGLLALVVLFVPLRRLVQSDWVFAGGAVIYLVMLRVVVAMLAKRAPRRRRHSGQE